jgi:hypothetical protein
MPIRFVFREPPITILNSKGADPQKIGQELTRIAEKSQGHLIPDEVVDAAKSGRSPIHQHFEWKNDVAAHHYRLEQARELIRCIRIVDDSKKDAVPRHAWLSINDKGYSYRALGEVLKSADLQLSVLKAAERDLRAFESRYQELQEICSVVRTARESLAEQINKQQRAKDADSDQRPPA